MNKYLQLYKKVLYSLRKRHGFLKGNKYNMNIVSLFEREKKIYMGYQPQEEDGTNFKVRYQCFENVDEISINLLLTMMNFLEKNLQNEFSTHGFKKVLKKKFTPVS